VTDTSRENVLFPGRDNYTGPVSGMFFAVHHEVLCEESHNILERVDYINREKPKHEVPTRLHNLMYLGGCEAAAKRKPLDDDYLAKFKPLDNDYRTKIKLLYDDYWENLKLLYDDYRAKRKLLDDDYLAKFKPLDNDYRTKLKPLDAEVLAYVRQHIPDCAWDESTNQLKFPEDM